jgi:hypothetical protein
MTAPELTLQKPTDGATWTATISGILGVVDQVATGLSAEEAAAAARRLARDASLEAAASEGLTVGPRQLALLEFRLREAASLAIARLSPKPVPAVVDPYGTDVSTFPDLDRSFRPIAGQRAIAECIARRWLTPRSSLEHAPDDGVDIRGLWHRGATDSLLQALQAQLADEAAKDERVLSADVELLVDVAAERLTVRGKITPLKGKPFRLVLTITDLVLQLEVLA